MQTIELVYFNAGGGHRAAAQALAAMAAQQQRPWQVRLTHLFEVLDPQRRFHAWTGMAPEAYYNARLARGWTLGLEQELKLLQAGIRVLPPTLVRRLQQHWATSEPDLVVSLVPNFNRAIGESLASTLPGVPFMTVLTDLADLPPSFWIEPTVNPHVVCATDRAVAQAQASGCSPDQVHRVSGMILRPEFHEPCSVDRDAERLQHGLDPAAMTGYERMAEVQEQILWACEAAHLPVVWATQVLETLARTGLQSRAEITDAAMGERAECVMLNKGPHIVDAMRTLDDILRRMQAHQSKKRPLLRALKSWMQVPEVPAD